MKNYKNIEVEIDNLSDSQKSDLKLAEIIVENMNNITTDKNSFSYDGRIFKPVVFGHEQGFISRLLNYVSNDNFNDSVDYILEQVSKNLTPFNKNSVGDENRKEYKEKIYKFLKRYPKEKLSTIQSEKLNSFLSTITI
jgi:hypothetical protein